MITNEEANSSGSNSYYKEKQREEFCPHCGKPNNVLQCVECGKWGLALIVTSRHNSKWSYSTCLECYPKALQRERGEKVEECFPFQMEAVQ